MPLLVSQHPPQLHYARDEAWVKFSSNEGPPLPAQFFLDVRAGSTAGDTLTFTWGGVDVVCTTASTPSSDGLSIPTQTSGQSLTDYADAIQDAFYRNVAIIEAFDLTRSTTANGAELIVFQAKSMQIFDLEVVSSNTAALSVLSLTNPDLDAPTITALIECYNLNSVNRVGLGQRSAIITSSFNAFFDLAASISLQAIIPPATLLDAGFTIATIIGNVMRYELRYGVQIGTPPVRDAFELYTSASAKTDIIAVHGRSPAFGYLPFVAQGLSASVYVLNATIEREEVLRNQPCFRYLVSTTDFDPSPGVFNLNVTVYRAGVAETIVNPVSLAAFKRGGSYVVPVGFYQLTLDTLSDSDSITHYVVSINATQGLFAIVQLGTFMVNPDCPDYRATLMFDNQLGGCDTLTLEGDQVWSNPTEVNPVRSPSSPTTGYSFTEGTRTGDHIVEGNTGYVSKTRAQHISTALPARAWILSGGDWLPGYLEKTSDTYLDTSTNLASVPLRFTLAAPQR